MKLMLAFYRGRSIFPSRMIRWFTWSHYSHVALCLYHDNGTLDLYDAWQRGGVRLVHDIMDGHDKGTRVDMYDFTDPLSGDEVNAAITAARKDLGKGYDWKGVLSQLLRVRCHDKADLFCSEAVMNWMLSAGRVLLRIESWKSSPGMLAASPELFPCGRYRPGSGPAPAP